MKLIDLLLTLDFEWPEGAEYVAQDMGVNKRGTIYFYNTLPKQNGFGCWTSFGGLVGRLGVHSLCSDCNTSTVSKEEYFTKLNKPSPIEDLISEIGLQQAIISNFETALVKHKRLEQEAKDKLDKILGKVSLKSVKCCTEKRLDMSTWDVSNVGNILR